MTDTPLDLAHAAMEAAPEDDRARLRFYERLADAELFLLLSDEATGETIKPEVFELQDASFVLVFDTEERLATFVGKPAPFAALSGRMIAQMLAPSGIGMGVNLEVAPSSILIPPSAVTWLVETLDNAPDEVEQKLSEVTAPAGLPEVLIEALDTKLSTAMGLARWAYLVGTVSETGGRGHMLGFVGAIPEAQDALAKAVDLHVQLFVAQSPGIGFWSDETVRTLEVALDLADRLGETPLRGDIVYGLVLSSYFRGNLERSIVSADELNLLAQASGDEAQLLVAQRLAGVGRLMSGRMNEAAPYLQRAEDLCAHVANQDLAARFGHDPIVGVYIYQSMLASFRGQTALAENYRMLSERRSKRVDHTNTTCTMYGLALFCAHISGDVSAERSHLTNMRLLVEEHSVTASQLWAEVAVALLKLADGENAIDEYWRSERAMLDANISLLVAGNRVLGARRIMALGHPDAARTMADAAEAQMRETGEQSWLPELHRVRAAFARQEKDEAKAEFELSTAVSAAQRSGAVLWELRASLDLARLYIDTDRIEQAKSLLASLDGKVGTDDCLDESVLARKLHKTISLTA